MDDTNAQGYCDGIGAEIMGAGMFGFHAFPDDPNWRGWWGDEPPFDYPVFVLTHRAPRPPLEVGGTTFHFLSATPPEAIERAVAAAGDRDVRVGGGARVVRDYLKARLWIRSDVAITPIIMGQGIRRRMTCADSNCYDVTSETVKRATTTSWSTGDPQALGRRRSDALHHSLALQVDLDEPYPVGEATAREDWGALRAGPRRSRSGP